MYFQNGPNSSEEDLQVSLYEAALLLIDVLKSTDGNGDPAPGNLPAVPSWCSCNSCREMPTERERCAVGKFPRSATLNKL